MLDPEHLVPELDGHLGIQHVEVAADHHADEPSSAQLCGRCGPHDAAVPQHGDAIGDGEYLVEPVGDVDDRHAVVAQSADDTEQVLHLGVAERGGGLVHDDDAGVEAERLRDLDQLPLAHTEPGDHAVRVDVQSELGHELLGSLAHRPPVEHAEAVPMLSSQEDVLVHRELGDQVELLVDHRDAAVLGLAGVLERRRLPVDEQRALELRVDAAHDAHEGRLPRPVLPNEGVDLSHAHIERHVLERDDTREALGDIAHGEDHGALVDTAHSPEIAGHVFPASGSDRPVPPRTGGDHQDRPVGPSRVIHCITRCQGARLHHGTPSIGFR